MDIREGDMITMVPAGFGSDDVGGLDGSVAALSRNDDGTITAEICIPGPPVP